METHNNMASSQSPPVIRPGSTSPAAVKKKRKAASPFIKRDHFRRQFLKSKMKNGVNGGVKKEEDPDAKANSLLKVKMDPYVKDEYDAIKKTERKDFPLQDANGNQEDEYDEYPLRAVDADAIMGIKNNIMKFQSKKPMIPEKNLHLPVRLHRKDTRNLQFQLTRAEIVQRQKEIAEYKKTMVEKESGKGGNKNEKTGNGKNEKGEDIFTTASGASITMSKPEASNAKNQTNAAATTGSSDAAQSNGDQPNAEEPVRKQEAGKVLYDGQETFEGEFEEGTIDPFADVAPDGGARAKRGWAGKRKTRKLRLLDENAKKLRFEEYYPWVLEDFDGYNTWVGSYEAGNSDQYVMFAVQKDGSFTMLPADKVYRFTARSQYATLTIEEAEKRFEKNKNVVPRWLMKHLDDIGTTTTRFDRTMRKLKAVDGMKKDGEDDDDDMDGLFGSRKDNSDNELDYDEEFQDDEEAPIIDGNEEENKESEQRLKKEMLQANAMGLRDAGSFPEDEEEEEDVEIDAEGKEVKKALRKTDLGALYDSDEEKNPYLSESDVEENKKEEEENSKSKEASMKADGDGSGKQATNGKSANEGTPKNKSPSKQRSGPKKVKKIKTSCKKYKNGVVLIKADPTILKNFPAGEWNPGKNEDSSVQQSSLKTEGAQAQQQQSLGTKEDRPLTEQDIIDIVSSGKITLKELIKELKRRITMDTENRERMRVYVKKLVKISDGFLELSK